MKERKEALKNYLKNKSPGTDGLTAEFCSFFWDLLSDTMVNSFNHGFQKGVMEISQRQSIIRLIPKKDKDLSRLENWRPISGNLCETENFTSKINKLQKLFNIWSQRDLSLYGRIVIAKLIYSSTCVQAPAQVSDIVNKLVINYIEW